MHVCNSRLSQQRGSPQNAVPSCVPTTEPYRVLLSIGGARATLADVAVVAFSSNASHSVRAELKILRGFSSCGFDSHPRHQLFLVFVAL
jgi:hypothetical protein